MNKTASRYLVFLKGTTSGQPAMPSMVIHSLGFLSRCCCCVSVQCVHNFVEFSNWIPITRQHQPGSFCLLPACSSPPVCSDVIFKEWMCFAYGPMAAAAHEEEAFSGHQRELITSSDKILFLKFIIRKKRGASERQKSLSLCYSSKFHLSCLASLLEQNETL